MNSQQEHYEIENEFMISGNWISHKKQIKVLFPQLTDTDLNYTSGKERELLMRIEIRLNLAREEVIRIIQELQSGEQIKTIEGS